MNKAHIKLWVEALRSGKYKQTKYNLNRDGEFCCLGVACEVAIDNGLQVEKVPKWSVGGPITMFYDDHGGTLPSTVRAWYDISAATQESLFNLNDCQGKTFLEIANYIETLLE